MHVYDSYRRVDTLGFLFVFDLFLCMDINFDVMDNDYRFFVVFALTIVFRILHLILY